jgi:hypothetical protein
MRDREDDGWRLLNAAVEALHALKAAPAGTLDPGERSDALEAVRTLWAAGCVAHDPAYFAKMAVELAEVTGEEPADLYRLGGVALLDLSTAIARAAER